MAENTCFYCENGEKLKSLMIEVCKLRTSTVYLFKNQSFKGRCVVAHNDHIKELFELNEEELKNYMLDVSDTAKAINDLFKADKINYAINGDKVPHLHYHIVPKHEGGYTWGMPFGIDKKVYLEDSEYQEIIELLREKLA